jgi:hypothetical protein
MSKCLYSNKLENLKYIDKFLDRYGHPKLNQEDLTYLNRFVTGKEIKAAIKSPKEENSRMRRIPY